MSTGTVTLYTWTCDRCGKETSRADERLPAEWITLDWFAPDPNGSGYLVPRPLHFERPTCLATWLLELPATVGPRSRPQTDIVVPMSAIVGWTGSDRMGEAVFGCPSCGTRTDRHGVNCTLHR